MRPSKDHTLEFPMPIEPKVGLIKRMVRWITINVPKREHLKDCVGIDGIDPRTHTYCCCHCECCPCFSWRCNTCLWNTKPVFKQVNNWAWR